MIMDSLTMGVHFYIICKADNDGSGNEQMLFNKGKEEG